MLDLAKALIVVAGVLITTVSGSQVQVTLVYADGVEAPFIMESVLYCDGRQATTWGQFDLDVTGVSTQVTLDRIARADLEFPGTKTVWRFTLKDGWVFDGFVATDEAALRICGVTEIGDAVCFDSFPGSPNEQPVIAIIVDPAFVGDWTIIPDWAVGCGSCH